MPCVTPRGELTPSGRSILELLVEPRDVQRIAEATGLPVFRTRAALREFIGAGLARQLDADRFAATEQGREKLQVAAR